MFRRCNPLIISILALILLIACEPTNSKTGAFPLEIVDGLGTSVPFSQPPQRIISLGPSNTEILFAVGAGDLVTGRDMFSDFPEEAGKAVDVGGNMGAFNSEAMVALEPDLVLASELIPPEQVDAWRGLGLKVFMLSNPDDLPGLFENLRTVGRITGYDEQADELVKSLEKRLANIDEKIQKATAKPVVFYELDATDPSAPYTSGPGTFVDMLIDRAGGVNLGASMTDAWASMSIEQLLVENPDVIVLGDFTWGGVTPEDVRSRQGWGALKAVLEDKVFVIDDNLISRPGPRMIDGLEALAILLHPELFEK